MLNTRNIDQIIEKTENNVKVISVIKAYQASISNSDHIKTRIFKDINKIGGPYVPDDVVNKDSNCLALKKEFADKLHAAIIDLCNLKIRELENQLQQ